MTEFETPRLRLRRVHRSDAPWIAALNSQPAVMKFISRDVPACEQALARAEPEIVLDQRDPLFGLWAVEDRATGEVHGGAALRQLAGAAEIAIGFRLQPSSWRRGIATEAAARLLAYGFEDLGLERVVGVAMPGNLASRRVLEKLGLRFERRVVFDGIAWDNYALSRAEWQQTRASPGAA
jgi:ribosomal-protein-alanine N-acetyltransferase